jgi:CDP-paratose 2-epimerase
VLDYARIYGMRTLVFRQSCIYGPRQFGMEDQGWLAWFCIRAAAGRPVVIYGNGKQVRDVLHVDDLIAGYAAAIDCIDDTSGKAYNVGGGIQNTLSLLELLQVLHDKFGQPMQYSFEDWRPGDQPVFVSDISRARRDFGWSPRIGVEEGVGRLIDWIRENRVVMGAAGPVAAGGAA